MADGYTREGEESGIVAFLRARLEEDVEEFGYFATAERRDSTNPEEAHVADLCTRLLTEVKSRKQIIDQMVEFADEHELTGSDPEMWLITQAFLLMASVYSDHPSYQESWKP